MTDPAQQRLPRLRSQGAFDVNTAPSSVSRGQEGVGEDMLAEFLKLRGRLDKEPRDWHFRQRQ